MNVKSKLSLFALFCRLVVYAQEPAEFVNPLIGTKGLFLYGRTTPFVTPPLGMSHWTACTRNSKIRIPNYHYFDTRIKGFRATHKPAMWMGDYGYVTLKPFTGRIKSKTLRQSFFFSHIAENAKPYYYSVNLITPGLSVIKTELTATERCGLLRFTFPEKKNPSVLIEASQLPDFDGWIKIDTQHNEVIGWNSDRHSSKLGPPLPNFKGYFVIRFSEPITAWGTFENTTLNKQQIEQQANACGAWVSFKPGTKSITATVATSFISLEQARQNLQYEINEQHFETVLNETRNAWNSYLNRIELEGASKRQKSIFYSAMYHALLFPRQFSEYGRYYSAFDDTIHQGISYNDYSLWDTYRAQHPLLILIAPEYGTMADAEQLIKEVHVRGMKIIFDMVMNHTSDEHTWFKESASSRDNSKSDWYIWRDKPTGWKSLIGGSGWHYCEARNQYYWASFLPFSTRLKLPKP